MVELLRERVIDDPYEWHHLVGEGEGDGDVGESVDKVRGAVDGVDDECGRWAQEGGCRRGRRFFAQEPGGTSSGLP